MTDTPAQAPPARRWAITDFIRGFGYPLKAVRFIHRHGLWTYTLASIGINILAWVGLMWAGIALIQPYLARMENWIEGSYLYAAMLWVLWVFVCLVVIVLTGVLVVFVGQTIASPLLDMLSEKAESIALDIEPEAFSLRRAWASFRIALADLLWAIVLLVVVNLALLITGPAAPVLGTGFNALLLAHEFTGLPMTRRLVPYWGRWRIVNRNASACLGLGLATLLMMLIPGLNLILLPVATVAGTLLYADLHAAGRAT